MLGAYLISRQVATNNGVTIALPSIGKELDFDESKLQWLVSAYSLSSVRRRCVAEKGETCLHLIQGCLLLVLGRLADLYGRKKLFTMGSFWLFALSLGCSFVNGQENSLACR